MLQEIVSLIVGIYEHLINPIILSHNRAIGDVYLLGLLVMAFIFLHFPPLLSIIVEEYLSIVPVME